MPYDHSSYHSTGGTSSSGHYVPKNIYTPWIKSVLIALVCILLLSQFPDSAFAQNDPILETKLHIPKKRGSRYKLLNEVTHLSGFPIIYDSQIIENEQTVYIPKGEYTIQEAILAIIGDRNLQLSIRNNHIIIHPLQNKKESTKISLLYTELITERPDIEDHLTLLKGSVIDKETQEPLIAANINISDRFTGTITNAKGDFELYIPDSLACYPIAVSYLGYKTEFINIDKTDSTKHLFELEPMIISMQEVVIRAINPQKCIERVLQNQTSNYSLSPVYLTAFYREGTHYNKEFIYTSEALFNIYKPGLNALNSSGQVKLLKMRNIRGELNIHHLLPRLEAGVHTALMLDIIQNPADFINPENSYMYNYAFEDIISFQDRTAYVISFTHYPYIHLPTYQGKLYIDTENYTLLQSSFELNPQHIEQFSSFLIKKKSSKLKIAPKQAEYTVSYKQINGTYYIHHIRADLHFKVRRKGQLFNTPMHVWLEMFTSEVITDGVQPFPKKEQMKIKSVFSKTQFSYDENFWESLNTILPDNKIEDIDSYEFTP